MYNKESKDLFKTLDSSKFSPKEFEDVRQYKGGVDLEYKIRPAKGHVIITDAQGKFICSCDNYKEAEKEIEEMEGTR